MMKYIVAVVLLLIIVAVALYNNTRKNCKENLGSGKTGFSLANTGKNELSVRFEEVIALSEGDEEKLVEVKDKKLLARIDNIVPGAAQALANTNAVKAYHDAAESAGQLYKAIIPKGAVLDKSRSMEGAVRGSYRNVPGSIKGNANWVAVDNNAAEGLAKVGSATAVMNVASMVVGQYYMTQINDQLGSINASIDKIADFQETEYKSKVLALVAEMQKASTFQMETMESDELRNRELLHLRTLEHECAELLGQANLSIQGVCDAADIDYQKYENKAKEAEKWYQCQQILLKVMNQIAELSYAMNLGKVSRKNSFALLEPYAKQANDALSKLSDWHMGVCEKLEIDTEEQRRKRQGIEGLFMGALGMINDNFNYKKVSGTMINRIEQQTGSEISQRLIDSDLFHEDVNLIAKNGKLYYLPIAE